MRSLSFPALLVAIAVVAAVLACMEAVLLGGDAAAGTPPGWTVNRPPHDVMALAIQGDVVWAGGRDGVVAVDRATGHVVEELSCDRRLDYVRDVIVDRDGTLWVAHDNGLSRYDGRSCRTLDETDGLPDHRVNALLDDTSGRLWVGTARGAAVAEHGGWTIFTTADGLADDMVNAIAEDETSGIWLGSYSASQGGVSRLANGRWQVITTREGLPHANVTAFFAAQDGSIWVGTGLFNRGGAARLESTDASWRVAEVLTRDNGLAGEKVRSIFQTRDGTLWFGSEYNGLTRVSADGMQVLGLEDGLSHPEVKCLAQDADGALWIGTGDGIVRVQALALREFAVESSGSGSRNSNSR